MTEQLIEIDEKYRDYCNLCNGKKMSKTEFVRQHVLNERNKLISSKFINSIFKEYGLTHKVGNLEMYQKAFVHDSYLECNLTNYKMLKQFREPTRISADEKAMPLFTESYQRLEYLGDSYIHAAIAKYLYTRYPDGDEGFLTTLRTKIENGKEQSKISRALGLHEYVIISRNLEQNGGRLNNYAILEDVLEAFIGALSLEVSSDECFKFVINIIEKHIDITHMIHYENNYKGRLMNECHAKKWDDVKYIDIKDENNANKYFKVKAVCGTTDKMYSGYGKAKSKKDAQQKAAKHILVQMKYIYNDNIDDDDDVYEEDDSDEVYGEYESE
jgi:ribonuclease-3